MKRTFIAIKVDPESGLLNMIYDLKRTLADEKIKWVDPSNIHLTLAFLGDTGEKMIKTLSAMLREKCNAFQEFEFVLAGTGVFKNFHDPRVIWAGIVSSEKLPELNQTISSGLKDFGFIIDARPFRPHLTLGRIKSVRDTGNLETVLCKYSDSEFQKVHVREVIFFESILTRTGPLYKPLGVFGLG